MRNKVLVWDIPCTKKTLMIYAPAIGKLKITLELISNNQLGYFYFGKWEGLPDCW